MDMSQKDQPTLPHYSVTTSQKKALAIATGLALVFGAYFLRNYLTLFIFSAILALIFNPFYKYRLKRSGKPGSAASQTLLVAFLAIIIPITIVIALTGVQVNATLHNLNNHKSTLDTAHLTQTVIDKSNQVLIRVHSSFRVTPEWINKTASTIVAKVASFVQNNALSYAGSFFSLFTTAVIFMFVFLSLLKNQQKILRTIRDLNPLGPSISDLYAEKVTAMTKAMVKGQFVIAIAQGFTDALLVYVAGFHAAFFLLFMLMTVLSIIPLGGGIIAIPIGIIMMLTGNILGGILVIAGHLLIVTNIDNVLRPRLVPREAKLDPALTILSVFAGISLLGFLGIIVGPVIMIVIATTIQVYLEVNKKAPHIKQVSE